MSELTVAGIAVMALAAGILIGVGLGRKTNPQGTDWRGIAANYREALESKNRTIEAQMETIEIYKRMNNDAMKTATHTSGVLEQCMAELRK